jgi:peptidyl-prolyl cis-trans isomerase D
MLGAIRKFSESIYAKILMGIIIIPFIFWGMGSNFIGGSKNIIVVIDKEKYSVQAFYNFIQKNVTPNQKIESGQIEDFLSAFIGEKLMEKEVEHFDIKLSDNSLSKLIRSQKNFKRENKFSRIEYEKFLLKNNITSIYFETDFSKHEKRKQLLNFIGGGVLPSKYLVNKTYNKINQKRNIDLINLNDVFNKKINFSENEIKSYFENNKNKYKDTYKSIKLIELNPKKLIGSDEFNDSYFKKIDEIDYMIIEGKNLEDIIQKFNLEEARSITLNKTGKDMNLKSINYISIDLAKSIFNVGDIDSISLIEEKDKYFIVKVIKTEEVQKKIENETVRKDIFLNLENEVKRKLISEIISKINKKNFAKSDFDKFSKDENIPIQKITLKNQNDDKVLKKDVISHIYDFPEKKIIVVHDINLSENFLIYIDNIENVVIKENSDEYQKYLDLSRIEITDDLYNTYDNYIKKRYKIDINYQTLDEVKNRFN